DHTVHAARRHVHRDQCRDADQPYGQAKGTAEGVRAERQQDQPRGRGVLHQGEGNVRRLMDGFLTSTWQIALSAIIPVALSVIFLVAESREPFASRIRALHGKRELDLTSLAILFGLFAALLVSDV